MDEVFLTSVFAQFGYHVQSIRWIRNYQTGSAFFVLDGMYDCQVSSPTD